EFEFKQLSHPKLVLDQACPNYLVNKKAEFSNNKKAILMKLMTYFGDRVYLVNAEIDEGDRRNGFFGFSKKIFYRVYDIDGTSIASLAPRHTLAQFLLFLKLAQLEENKAAKEKENIESKADNLINYRDLLDDASYKKIYTDLSEPIRKFIDVYRIRRLLQSFLLRDI